MREFMFCDAHPSQGGPHKSRGLFAGFHPSRKATLWSCTFRSRKGTACGAISLELAAEQPGWLDGLNEVQRSWNHQQMWELSSQEGAE